MDAKIIIIVIGILLIAYMISAVKHLKIKSFRSKLIETVSLSLFLIGHIISVVLIGKGLFPTIIFDIILFALLIYDVICLIRLAKDSNKDSHFVKIDGRTYIVRNIYSKD